MNNPTPNTTAFLRDRASAIGVCFHGVCAVLKLDEARTVAIIAPDTDVLAEAWPELAQIPLKQDAVQRVALFAEKSLSIESALEREMLGTLQLVAPILDAMRAQFPRCEADDSLDIVALVHAVIAKAECRA